ncbi:MAG: hypothetical protein HOK28_13090 [Deltaproteobacteria bacterium]|jgi:hypothetical protein|nr:hypothetical protein [Deltaproteobacteria bacterium]
MDGPIRHVVLPWTQPAVTPDASQAPNVLELQKDSLVKVGESHQSSALQDSPRQQLGQTSSEGNLDNPWYNFMKLEPPQIPEEHRSLLNETGLIGASIILDVFTTRSAELQEEETILSELAQLLLDTNLSVNGDSTELENVAKILIENEGTIRQQLGESLQEAATVDDKAALPNPLTVTLAIRSIEAMSDVAIREVTLIIDGQPVVEHKQI